MDKAKALLGRSSTHEQPATAADKGAPKRNRFNFDSLRNQIQPDLAKKLFSLIKSEGHIVESYESAGRERSAFASQLSGWGDSTQDDAVSEVTDRLAVLLRNVAEVEDEFAVQLEESRLTLKSIRDTEKNVGPIRENKAKVAEKLDKARRDGDSSKVPQLEQELSRAEAESLVAEVQLTNVTRHKLKASYDIHLAAMLERSEKQAILARHARRLMNLIDDDPIKPGDLRVPFAHQSEAQNIVSDAREELQAWNPSHEHIETKGHHIGDNALSKENPTKEDIAHAVRVHVQEDNPGTTIATRPPPSKEEEASPTIFTDRKATATQSPTAVTTGSPTATHTGQTYAVDTTSPTTTHTGQTYAAGTTSPTTTQTHQPIGMESTPPATTYRLPPGGTDTASPTGTETTAPPPVYSLHQPAGEQTTSPTTTYTTQPTGVETTQVTGTEANPPPAQYVIGGQDKPFATNLNNLNNPNNPQ